MKLHEAIVKVLQEKGTPMTTKEIADRLNLNHLYQKRDGSLITAYQIHGRTKNYSHLFDRNGTYVSLKGQSITTDIKKSEQDKQNEVTLNRGKIEQSQTQQQLPEKVLMNEKRAQSADSIEELVPDTPGLYCFRIKNIYELPEPFATEMKNRGHNILYIGKASNSLYRRMLLQELRAVGHGTFFRSIGAVLGFCPPANSLLNKKNKRNYTFSPEDEAKIIHWINKNLLVNWVQTGEPLKYEKHLIEKYLPLLNLDHNPAKLESLSQLRKKCVDIANGNI